MLDNLIEVSNADLTCASHSASPHLDSPAMTIRRRYDRWPAEERARIVAESFSPGETIAQVARRNGVGLGLLHYWRRQARNSGAVEELRFVPLTLTSEPKSGSGGLELLIRDVTVRVAGEVDVACLRAVLEAIRA